MCIICDGVTEQEHFESMRSRIEAGHWALQGVEPGPSSAGWVYTVGLIENFGQAELVIGHVDLRMGGSLLNEIGERVSGGLRIDAGDALDLDGYVLEFEEVHTSYLNHGLCASWDRYYRGIGTRPGRLRALQVVPPLSEWCDHCDRKRRCLATPGSRDFGGGLNRAARRARSRH